MEYGIIIMFAGFFLMLEIFDFIEIIKNKEEFIIIRKNKKESFKIDFQENNINKEKFDACS